MYLATNIRFLRQQAAMTQEVLSNRLGIKRTMISAYEDGRSEPKLGGLMILAEVFGVTVDELLTVDLSKKGRRVAADMNLKILAITIDRDEREGICMVSQRAAAGYLNGYSDTEYVGNLPQFHLPNLPKDRTYRAFEISGDSMLPVHPGTIVIGAYVESLREVKSARTYVLVTKSEGVVYKRVFNYLDERGKFFLVSDNEIYKPFELDPSELLEIWEAKAFISTDFPRPHGQNPSITLEEIAEMIRDLKAEVTKTK
ncbi:XRE family transcriptional regulator [Lunatimonas salinarum]|uniref:XRE family transcriptional regulator n=1 Tax=Lunatimonas salinarum TaxID=1774590 RepID=UPI001ADF8BDF|nr:LexA family transcriptional regulator [Lunatimonas salinarum]